jgi:hypothetical protein
MIKYIDNLVKDFLKKKNGIEKNASLWQNMPINIEEIDTIISELRQEEKKIEDALAIIKQSSAKARLLETNKRKKLLQIERLAYGLHLDNTSLLLDYGIKLRKTKTKKTIPSKGYIKSIIDDYDAEGFIIQRKPIQDAENYQWEKAKGDDVAVTNIDESKFILFKITKTKSLVDDDVKKGIRYFYRYRGFNASGNGPWSEPVSRVQ